jgi:hypothetical protein
MLHAGLDLGRKKLDVCLLSDRGEHLDQLAVAPDVDSQVFMGPPVGLPRTSEPVRGRPSRPKRS